MGWLQWQDWESQQQRRRRHQGRDSREPQHKIVNPVEDANRKRRQQPVKGKKAWDPHLRDGLKSTRKGSGRTPRDLFGGVRSIVQGGAPGMGKKHGKRR
jgi:hypothetical protein